MKNLDFARGPRPQANGTIGTPPPEYLFLFINDLATHSHRSHELIVHSISIELRHVLLCFIARRL